MNLRGEERTPSRQLTATVIKSRLLIWTQFEAGRQGVLDVRHERLVRKPGQDFHYNPKATVACAVVSYLTITREIQSITEAQDDSLCTTFASMVGPAGFELATVPAGLRRYRCLRFNRMSRSL